MHAGPEADAVVPLVLTTSLRGSLLAQAKPRKARAWAKKAVDDARRIPDPATLALALMNSDLC